MEVIHKELAESRDTRERYKDFLMDKIGQLYKIQEKDEAVFKPRVPESAKALSLWMKNLKLDHYMRILAILAEHEKDPQLLEILANEEKYTAHLNTASNKAVFVTGFITGYERSCEYAKQTLNDMFFNAPRIPEMIESHKKKDKE